MASIGDNIKRFRKERHLSQLQLAEVTGINVKSLSFYENGKRHIPGEYLIPLADALGVSIDELCGVVKKQTPEDELMEKADRALREVLMDYTISSK